LHDESRVNEEANQALLNQMHLFMERNNNLDDFMEFQRNRISINPVDAITELMQVHLRN